MGRNRHGSHTVSRLTVHVVWVTKYRYHVLKGEIQKRCRVLLVQICDAEDVRILKGVVSKDYDVPKKSDKKSCRVKVDSHHAQTSLTSLQGPSRPRAA